MNPGTPKAKDDKSSRLKSIYSHNISLDGIVRNIDSESINTRQNIYAAKLPINYARDIIKSKNKSTKRATNAMKQRDSLIEQTLKPYLKPSSPVKLTNRSPTRRQHEEKDEKIGITLKKKYFNNSTSGSQFDLFVPNRTETRFKSKPRTTTLSILTNSKPIKKGRVLTSLKLQEKIDKQEQPNETPPQSGKRQMVTGIQKSIPKSILK